MATSGQVTFDKLEWLGGPVREELGSDWSSLCRPALAVEHSNSLFQRYNNLALIVVSWPLGCPGVKL